MVKRKARPGTFARKPEAEYGSTTKAVEVSPAELPQVGVDCMLEPKERLD